MRLQASHKTWVLLLTLVGGSIVAPASHYLFMALSDVYTSHHSAQETLPSDPHAHHRGEVKVAPEMGPALADSGSEHVGCTYADLFATHAAAGLPPASPGHLLAETGLRPGTNPVSLPIAPPSSLHLRGPPQG